MVREHLRKFSERDRWITELTEDGENGRNGWECEKWTLALVCGPVEDGTYCSVKDVFCEDWIFEPDVPEEDDPGGGGDGDDIGGDDSDPCHIDGDPMLDGPCIDGGGGFSDGGGNEIPRTDDDYTAAADTVDTEDLPACGDPDGINAWSHLPPDDEETMVDLWMDYCESSLPNATQENRISDTLDDIEARGGMCVDIAQRGRSYLNNDLIYIDPDWGVGDASRQENAAAGHGQVGLVIIWKDYVDLYYGDLDTMEDGYTTRENLDSILAHEFGHVLGQEHDTNRLNR